MLPQQHTTVFQTGPLFADSNPLTWKALYPFCWPLMSEAFQQKVTGSEKGSKNKRWKSKRREGLATSLACNAGVLFGRVNAKKLAIIYWTGHVWFRLRVYGGGRGRGKAKRTILTAPEPSSLLLLDRCSPQPSAAIKISDDSCNFHQDNTRHSPAKITPAPQANTSLKGTSRNLAIRTPVSSQVQKSKNTYHSTWFYCKLTSQWFVLGSRHHEYINERDTAFPLVRSIDCTLTNETTGQNLVHYLLQERENLVGFLAVISLLMKTIPCLQWIICMVVLF